MISQESFYPCFLAMVTFLAIVLLLNWWVIGVPCVIHALEEKSKKHGGFISFAHVKTAAYLFFPLRLVLRLLGWKFGILGLYVMVTNLALYFGLLLVCYFQYRRILRFITRGLTVFFLPLRRDQDFFDPRFKLFFWPIFGLVYLLRLVRYKPLFQAPKSYLDGLALPADSIVRQTDNLFLHIYRHWPFLLSTHWWADFVFRLAMASLGLNWSVLLASYLATGEGISLFRLFPSVNLAFILALAGFIAIRLLLESTALVFSLTRSYDENFRLGSTWVFIYRKRLSVDGDRRGFFLPSMVDQTRPEGESFSIVGCFGHKMTVEAEDTQAALRSLALGRKGCLRRLLRDEFSGLGRTGRFSSGIENARFWRGVSDRGRERLEQFWKSLTNQTWRNRGSNLKYVKTLNLKVIVIYLLLFPLLFSRSGRAYLRQKYTFWRYSPIRVFSCVSFSVYQAVAAEYRAVHYGSRTRLAREFERRYRIFTSASDDIVRQSELLSQYERLFYCIVYRVGSPITLEELEAECRAQRSYSNSRNPLLRRLLGERKLYF